MKQIKFRKEDVIHLCIAIAAIVLLGVAVWSGKKYYDETEDLRQVESDMQALRDDLQFRDVGTIPGEDGVEHIEYNPYTPYFLGHEQFFCWLQMTDTPIDYPVAQAPANDEYYYLSHEFTGRANRYGCPYVVAEQREDDDIIYIAAHNNANTTMFGTFVDFNEEDYFNEHWSLTLDFADVRREYEIFAVMDIGLNDSRFEFWDVLNFNEDRTEEAFLNQVLGMSFTKRYEGIDNLIGSEQYVCMLTCEYSHSHGRRIVFARLINETPYDREINAEIISHEDR